MANMLVMMLVMVMVNDDDDHHHESGDVGHDVDYDGDDVDDGDDTDDVDGEDGSNVFLRLSFSPPPLIIRFRGRQSPKTPNNDFFIQI